MSIRSPLFVPQGLPPLTSEVSKRIEEMVSYLRYQINDAGGSISFADYMNIVLYNPHFGYYTGGLHKFGGAGDFVTAPEISPLFAQCVARQLAQILPTLKHPIILEIGAGSGVLAAALLENLAQLGITVERYLILELSSELRTRQSETLAAQTPNWLNKVAWLTDLPNSEWEGVIIANEFLDALPIHRFALTKHGIMEQQVMWNESGFAWHLAPPAEDHLKMVLTKWHEDYGLELTDDYNFELSLAASAWLSTMAARLKHGLILIIDYGYAGGEYYHPTRRTGTLACHYRHHRHYDPLILPGVQDITAHVNFTSIAEAAVNAGLTLAGYTTQGQFLIATGIAEIFSQSYPHTTREQLLLSNQIRRLTFPQEMGEIFKVIAFTCDVQKELIGFQNNDLSNRL